MGGFRLRPRLGYALHEGYGGALLSAMVRMALWSEGIRIINHIWPNWPEMEFRCDVTWWKCIKREIRDRDEKPVLMGFAGQLHGIPIMIEEDRDGLA